MTAKSWSQDSEQAEDYKKQTTKLFEAKKFSFFVSGWQVGFSLKKKRNRRSAKLWLLQARLTLLSSDFKAACHVLISMLISSWSVDLKVYFLKLWKQTEIASCPWTDYLLVFSIKSEFKKSISTWKFEKQTQAKHTCCFPNIALLSKHKDTHTFVDFQLKLKRNSLSAA